MIESKNMYGIHRCGKRRELLKKVPEIDNNKEETPDIAEMIISGIFNFGPDADMIRMMASEYTGMPVEKIMIPYDDINFSRTKFLRDVITKKLTFRTVYSVQQLIETFYEFLDAPTDTTKKLQAESDIRDVMRYLDSEDRRPVVIGNPVIKIAGHEIECDCDMLFDSVRDVKVGKEFVRRHEIEVVRIFSGKPKVRQSSAILDVGISSRLEAYVMAKVAEKWCADNEIKDVGIKASYYYLQKSTDKDGKYADNFFGKGGNVVSIELRLSDMSKLDKIFLPQIESFVKGEVVDVCDDCSMRSVCKYKEIQAPLSDEEKPMPKALPALSHAQKKAAETLEGYIRVIATAGSGKTTTMSYRIMNLLKSGVEPEKIGCFTFTNAGAAEMRDRIKGFCAIAGIDADVEKITISTIHSFGDMLLKEYFEDLGYKRPPVMINEVQRIKIVEDIISRTPPLEELIDKYKNFYMDFFNAKGILKTMIEYFNMFAEGVSVDAFKESTKLSDGTVDTIVRMYIEYTKIKKEECLIDHSDQEQGVLKLLKVRPHLFNEVGIVHISVDEYQDTSNIQFNIINEMRKNPDLKSLFIVGDDDQSIYGFRGANVELIKDFFDMIGEDGDDIHLMENRRSTPEIVMFSSKIMENNENRIPKNPVSTKESGAPISVCGFKSKDEEMEFIVNEVEKMVEKRPENDIAVLCSTNGEILEYVKRFDEKGIKTVSINPEPILENVRVMAAISFVKFFQASGEFNGMVYLNAKMNGKMDGKMDEELQALRDELDGVYNGQEFMGYLDALDPNCQDEIFQTFLDDVKALKSEDIISNNIAGICEYIIDVEKFGEKETGRREKAYNGVVLSTMHSSKGKEWPVVFCSVTKMMNKNIDDIEEKNRVLFVACTRAKEELIVTGVEKENIFFDECVEALNECRFA